MKKKSEQAVKFFGICLLGLVGVMCLGIVPYLSVYANVACAVFTAPFMFMVAWYVLTASDKGSGQTISSSSVSGCTGREDESDGTQSDVIRLTTERLLCDCSAQFARVKREIVQIAYGVADDAARFLFGGIAAKGFFGGIAARDGGIAACRSGNIL